MEQRGRYLSATALFVMLVGVAPPAQGGCGCQKAPPDLSSVRPNATYAGTALTLFSPSFVVGSSYTVEFASGTSTATASVTTRAVSLRDLADGAYKPQVVVAVPSSLPLGPTRITARLSGQSTLLLQLSDAAFTVVPQPVVVPETLGGTSYTNYRAAIGRDGTFYISLDMSAVKLPRLFRAQAKGYPLVFASDDVTFYNTQGFLMQLLNSPMAGLYSIISSASSADSSILGYSRHEFSTFYVQHGERQAHTVIDGNWHSDGARHVDHDHLVLAISGTLYNGQLPAPGATPPFTLRFERSSLFQNGAVALSTSSTDSAFLEDGATTDSFNSRTLQAGSQGDVLSNGKLVLDSRAQVLGDATAAAFSRNADHVVAGDVTALSSPAAYLQVKVPDMLPSLGAFSLTGSATYHLAAGSYQMASLTLRNTSILYVDNCTGPVTVYVTGTVTIQDAAQVLPCDPNPERFAVYVSGPGAVTLGTAGYFYGVLYAPQSSVWVAQSGDLYGAAVAHKIHLEHEGAVHFDEELRGGQSGAASVEWPAPPEL